MYSIFFSVCTRLFARFPGNPSVDLPIVCLNLMFCRWDVQTPSMPLCLYFPLPLYRQPGKQMIILWTHYSAWSSYHNQPSRVSNLGSAKLCSAHNGAFVSVLLCFYDTCAREGSREREEGREMDCLHTFAHLSLGIFHQSEIRQVCGRVSVLGTQWTTHKGCISSYLHSSLFLSRLSLLTLCPANITAPQEQEPAVGKLHRGGAGQLKGLRVSPVNNGLVQ